MLDQFGISRTSYSGGLDNGFENYLNAVMNPSLSLWQPSFTDLASYDMGPQACAAFNGKTQYTYTGTYYFSHVTSRTTSCNGNQQCPVTNFESSMEVLMQPTGTIIGSIASNPLNCTTNLQCSNANSWCQAGAGSHLTNFCYDSTYQENDGLVPKRSSLSPEIGVAAGTYVAPLPRNSYSNSWTSATWYYSLHTGDSGTNGRDHIQIIGFDLQVGDYIFDDGADGTFTNVLAEIYYAWAH